MVCTRSTPGFSGVLAHGRQSVELSIFDRATIGAIGLFIAALIGVSTKSYNEFVKLQNATEPDDSFVDEEVGEVDEE